MFEELKGDCYIGIRFVHLKIYKIFFFVDLHTMQVVFSFHWGFVLGIRHYEPTEKEPYTEAQFFLGPMCITLMNKDIEDV